MIERLLKDIYSLQRMPERFAKAQTQRYLTNNYRKLVSRPYLIFYRIDAAQRAVYIVTIRHGAMRPL